MFKLKFNSLIYLFRIFSITNCVVESYVNRAGRSLKRKLTLKGVDGGVAHAYVVLGKQTGLQIRMQPIFHIKLLYLKKNIKIHLRHAKNIFASMAFSC